MGANNKQFINALHFIKLDKIIIFAGTFIYCASALANPVLNSVGAGSVSFQHAPNTLTINQSSPQAILNWNSFNIGAQERTSFIQPAGGIALNRISPTLGPSSIYGVLTATGQIILVNPAGIYFGPSAVVNVGGLIATTAGISNRDFLNRNYVFTNAGPGSVVNAGRIIAAKHGLVALVGSNVTNSGYIQANLGSVVLATGDSFTMSFAGNDLINFKVGGKAGKVTNTGTLIANGGKIMVSAAAAKNVLDNVINMEGVAQAKSVYKKGGEIIISGDPSGGVVRVASKLVASGKGKGHPGGKVKVTGYAVNIEAPTIIDVSGDTGGGIIQIGKDDNGTLSHSTTINSGVTLAANTVYGDGGFIETSGDFLDIKDGITIDTSSVYGKTGTWLLDPANLTICTGIGCSDTSSFAGNTYSPNGTNSKLLVSTLTGALNSTNITVQTTSAGTGGNGDIFVDTPISWNSSFSLTLSAYHDIVSTNIPMNSGNIIQNFGSGDVVLQADNTGTGFGTVIFNAGNDVTTGGNVKIYYNPAVFGTQDTIYSGGTTPIQYMLINNLGNFNDPITAGTLGALSNPVNSSYWNENYALGKNIIANATNTWNAGAGFSPIGNTTTAFTGSFDGLNHTISNLYINNSSGALEDVGLFGVVNSLMSPSIANLTLANPTIISVNDGSAFLNNVGALAGRILNNGIVDNVTVNGGSINVSGDNTVYNETGGLIGTVTGTTSSAQIINSSASININSTSQSDIGGLVGYLNGGSIDTSHATGTVTSTYSDNESTGGLVGFMDSGATVSNSYATGTVTSASTSSASQIGVGGLVGYSSGDIFSSYATGNVISSGDYTGGLVGQQTGVSVISSYATGSVSGANYVGGLLGYNGNGDVTSSYATGDVTGIDFVGGLIGDNSGIITSSYATGDVDGNDFVGGLIGQNFYKIFSSYATGTVTGHDSVGGLLGYTDNDVTSSYATGNVSGHATVGGLVGDNEATITDSHATGAITATSNRIGGLVGFNNGIITTSYASGNVSGLNNVGGLVGLNLVNISDSFALGNVSGNNSTGGLIGGSSSGTVSTSYAAGDVTSTGNNVGGLVGFNDIASTIQDTYAFGSVSGVSTVGGLVGNNFGNITRSYASGPVSGTSNVGGFVGFIENGSSVSDSFWDTDTSTKAQGFGGKGVTGTFTNLEGGCFDGTCTIQPGANSSNPGAAVNLSSANTYSALGWSIGAAPNNGTFTWTIFDGSTRPYLTMESNGSITTAHSLQAIGTTPTSLTDTYTISQNIDFSSDVNNPSDIWGGSTANFSIATSADPFTGTLIFDQDNQIFTAGGLFLGAGATISSTGSSLLLDTPITLTGAGNITFDVLNSLVIPDVVDGTTGTLIKAGVGTLIFQGANTYTGATDINAGVLQVNNGSTLGNPGGAVTVASGATLLLNNASIANPLTLFGNGIDPFNGLAALQSIGNSSYDGTIALNTNSVIGSFGTFALNGVISGAGTSLTLTGNPTIGTDAFILSKVNTYSGSTIIGNPADLFASNGASVILTNGDAFHDTSDINLYFGSSLVFSLPGSFTPANNSTITMFADNNSINRIDYENTSVGAGTLTLNNPIIASGNLQEFSTSLFGSVGPANLNLTGNIDMGGTSAIALAAMNPSDTLELSGVISNGPVFVGLFLPNAGTVILSNGGNTYADGTFLESGTLRLDAATALGTGFLAFLNNATLTTNGNYTITNPYEVLNTFNPNNVITLNGTNGFTLSGAATLDAGTELVVDNAAGTVILDSLNGGGSLTKSNTGTLSLTGTNTYTGATTVNGGILSVNSLGSTAISVNNSTLFLNNTTISPTSLLLNNGILDSTGNSVVTTPITLSAAGGTLSSAGNLTILGSVSGPGALFANAGTISLLGGVNVASLSSGVPMILAGNITTSGSQFYTALQLAGDVVFTTNGNDLDMNFLDSATATPQNVTFNLGAGRLGVTGFIGSTNPLGNIVLNSTGHSILDFDILASSFTSNGGITELGGSVTTSGAQIYNSQLIANSATPVNLSSGTSLSLNQGVSDNGSGSNLNLIAPNILLSGAIGTLNSLTITGTGANNTFTFNSLVSPTWLLTGTNTGNILGLAGLATTPTFTNIQNIVSGAGNDTLALNGFSLTGSFNAGAGANTLMGSDIFSNWFITGLGTGSGGGIGAFSNFQSIIGGANDDTFYFSGAGLLAGNLSGGGGNNTIVGSNPVNVWTITGLNSGLYSGLNGSFSGIQNFIGGAFSNNTFILTSGAQVTGIINGGNTTSSTMSLANYSSSIPVNVLLSPTNKFNGVFIIGGTQVGDTIIGGIQIPYQNIGSIIGNGLGTLLLTAAQRAEAIPGLFGPLSGILGDPLFWNGFQFNFTPVFAISSVSSIIQQPDINGTGVTESNAVWVYQDESLARDMEELTIETADITNSELKKVKIDPFCAVQ